MCPRDTDIFEIIACCVNFANGTHIRLEINPNAMLISKTSTLPNEGACSSEVFALSRCPMQRSKPFPDYHRERAFTH